MIPAWLMFALVFGVNFSIWGTVGSLRIADSALDRFRRRPRNVGSAAHRALRADRGGPVLAAGADPGSRILTVADVAVLMAAHNEEVVIDDSLAAITALVPPENVHVVSDASSDSTVARAASHGVNVTETATNVGKAGALEEGIRTFGLAERFSVVLLLDADTRLDPGYFEAALPLFDDPGIVAVAGCAHSNWHTPGSSFLGRLVTAHRSRIYALTQRLLKYGQTWRRANATHIVPGFASMYRTAVLPHITINPAGLVIEDFNMTFEVYRKRLGRVGFTVGAIAVTQDPDTVRDYVKQTKRWALGLWQTVRRHRLHLDLLSAMVGLLLLELLTASLVFLVLPVVLVILAVPDLFPAALHWPAATTVHSAIASHVSLRTIGLGVLLPDLLLTTAVAVVEKRPRYLLYGPFFLFMRTVDAGIAVYTLPRAWREKSNGRWVSPARRDPVGGVASQPVGRLRDQLPELEPAEPELADARSVAAAAEAGNVEAQVRIGWLFAATLDPPDLGQARLWWTRAAEAGHAEAQFNLGIMLATELDPPELAEARMWWTRAAEAGHAEAQANLGILLADLLDPPRLEEARGWYAKAAAAGNIRAQYGLGRLLATALEPPELAEARTWWTQAAEAGHAEAQYGLARLLADLLDPPEIEEARTWYAKAAEAGRAEAQYDLGVLLAERLDPPHLDEARSWYTKAADAGHSGARFKLGLLLAAQIARPQLTRPQLTSPDGDPSAATRGWTRRRAGT